ncbi:hypothetical protein [Maridesulfovibrio bastinii]|uniref:hypothetical protein n=1 Tax=Maridesulfovibrio bastinii TaxID=47157 RepID=UPI0003F5ECC5|nr:hypothetical protein [Maridesulfovibrio bastinii]
MIIGYYDLIGFSSLYKGSAATQTSDVDQGIASERSASDPGHYEDYSLPMDTYSDNPIPDKSEAPAGDEHTSDCVADFMQTSFSSRDNFYGWSWSTDISPAFLKYVQYKNSSYIAESSTCYMSNNSLNWTVLKREIDNNRPMVFLVDSSGNGYTDHFVAVVGYREGTELEYGCLDTWSPASTVRWCTFTGMSSGHNWGVWGGWSFSLTGKTKLMVPQNMLLLQ